MHGCFGRDVLRGGDAGGFRPLCHVYGDANHDSHEYANPDQYTDTDQDADCDDYTDINDHAHRD